MDSQCTDSCTSPKYTESGVPDSLKSHIQTMLDSEDPERKHLAQFLDAKFNTSDTCYPVKEGKHLKLIEVNCTEQRSRVICMFVKTDCFMLNSICRFNMKLTSPETII